MGKGLELPSFLERAEACGAYSNVSCGPPRSEASARATQRVARTPPPAPPYFGFGLRAPGVGRRPSAQARRFYEPQKQHFLYYPNPLGSSSARPPRAAKASPSPRTAIPQGIALLALSLKRGKKHSPTLRPVSASLRLRCRSAAFSRALRDSFYFGSPPK